MDIELTQRHAGDGEDPALRVGSVAEAPQTGDESIDASLHELAAAQTGTLAERIEAGERAHAALQSRLSDLGGA